MRARRVILLSLVSPDGWVVGFDMPVRSHVFFCFSLIFKLRNAGICSTLPELTHPITSPVSVFALFGPLRRKES
jgi:hypothetical protein